MKTEIWKPINDDLIQGRYEVSNLGRVRNKQTGYILKGSPLYNGYLLISLRTIEHKSKTYRIHILVARAFLGEQPPGKEVNHKNGMKDDNRAENLEWMTRAENIQHYYHVTLGRPKKKPTRIRKSSPCGEEHHFSKLTANQVREIKLLLNENELTQTAIAKLYGMSVKAINHIARGRRWASLDCDESLTHHRT